MSEGTWCQSLKGIHSETHSLWHGPTCGPYKLSSQFGIFAGLAAIRHPLLINLFRLLREHLFEVSLDAGCDTEPNALDTDTL